MRKPPKNLTVGPLDTYDEVWTAVKADGRYWWIGVEMTASGKARVSGYADGDSAGFAWTETTIDDARRQIRAQLPMAKCARAGTSWTDRAGFRPARPTGVIGPGKELSLC